VNVPFAGPPPGLCGACTHARIVETRRGSRFYLCERSRSDPRFPQYPPLPVLRCPGFDKKDSLGTSPA
jgi:hypothetical protein